MADVAQRVLMNEFKALSKETWTNIDVRIATVAISTTKWRPPVNESISD